MRGLRRTVTGISGRRTMVFEAYDPLSNRVQNVRLAQPDQGRNQIPSRPHTRFHKNECITLAHLPPPGQSPRHSRLATIQILDNDGHMVTSGASPPTRRCAVMSAAGDLADENCNQLRCISVSSRWWRLLSWMNMKMTLNRLSIVSSRANDSLTLVSFAKAICDGAPFRCYSSR